MGGGWWWEGVGVVEGFTSLSAVYLQPATALDTLTMVAWLLALVPVIRLTDSHTDPTTTHTLDWSLQDT
jgi:hypothetical protein